MSDLEYRFKLFLNVSDQVIKVVDYTTLPLVYLKCINFLYDELSMAEIYNR